MLNLPLDISKKELKELLAIAENEIVEWKKFRKEIKDRLNERA